MGSPAAIVELRERLAAGGCDIVEELEPGQPGAATDVAEALVVLNAADAFPSLESFLGTLQGLGQRGMAFESMEEPWLNALGGHTASATSSAQIALPHPFVARASRFLDLSIDRMEADLEAAADQARRREMQTEVGGLLGQLLFLVTYAVVVGAVSQAVLNAALLDPALLSRRLSDLLTGSSQLTGAVTNAIPDALRGIVFSTLSSLLLLLFRGTSLGLRAELGGVLFMGFVALAAYGLCAGFGTGVAGALIALPGLVLAGVLMHEFLQLVLRVTAPAAGSRPARGTGLLSRARHLLDRLEEWAAPRRSQVSTAAFIGLPILILAVSVGAAFTNGGWLYWPARIGLFAAGAWSAWALLVTPAPVRIPLWSILAWATVLLLLSAATVVTAVFAAAIVVLLAVGVFEMVLRTES